MNSKFLQKIYEEYRGQKSRILNIKLYLNVKYICEPSCYFKFQSLNFDWASLDEYFLNNDYSVVPNLLPAIKMYNLH